MESEIQCVHQEYEIFKNGHYKVHGYLVAGFYEIWHANDYIIVTSETFITTMKNGQFYELEFYDIYLIDVYLIVQVKQK